MDKLQVRQSFDVETSTYTYLLIDRATRQALLIDPVLEQVERDKRLIDELEVELIYLVETHIHADHVSGSMPLRDITGARIVLGKHSGVEGADLLVDEGDRLHLGASEITCLSTPGHTPGCMSFYTGTMVFCGDSLLIRANGRTDFQGGDSKQLYASVTKKLYQLPSETLVYPAHDYQGLTSSTIEEEMKFNRRLSLGVSEVEFMKKMADLNLAAPKKIDVSVPANQNLSRTP